jgi:hypothetical protein
MALLGFESVTTVLNVHGPTEDKSDDMKNRFYRELECVFPK